MGDANERAKWIELITTITVQLRDKVDSIEKRLQRSEVEFAPIRNVMDKVEELHRLIDSIKEDITELRVLIAEMDPPSTKRKVEGMQDSVARLEVKAGIWGGIAGLISAVATALILLMKR